MLFAVEAEYGILHPETAQIRSGGHGGEDQPRKQAKQKQEDSFLQASQASGQLENEHFRLAAPIENDMSFIPEFGPVACLKRGAVK